MAKTVLIVDDIDANLYLLKTIFSYHGYHVKQAKNGKEALKISSEAAPDLIVSDILMPIMDGFALCKACKQNETLRHIIGFSEILIEDHKASLNKEVSEIVDRIHRAGRKMDVIIHALLRLSKLKATSLKKTRVNLSVIAENIMAKLSENEKNRPMDIRIQQDVYADCDKDMLQIVLENLLGNAWKYTSKKDTVFISFGYQLKDSNNVFFVKDNGAGFNMEYEKELFKPFKRNHSQSDFQGIGVGLATVKRIVTHHNGETWAEGELQQGACFYFTLK